MGNPPILNRTAVDHASTPALCASQVIWDVFVMRHEGCRVPREQLRPLRGTLTIETRCGAPSAWLSDAWGNDLARLEQVQIRRLLPTGALLLRGMQSVAHSKWGMREHKSAWWCRLHGAGGHSNA